MDLPSGEHSNHTPDLTVVLWIAYKSTSMQPSKQQVLDLSMNFSVIYAIMLLCSLVNDICFLFNVNSILTGMNPQGTTTVEQSLVQWVALCYTSCLVFSCGYFYTQRPFLFLNWHAPSWTGHTKHSLHPVTCLRERLFIYVILCHLMLSQWKKLPTYLD